MSVHQVDSVLQQYSARSTRNVVEDLTASGVGGVGTDTADLKCSRIDPIGVPAFRRQRDRVVGCYSVEVGGSGKGAIWP